MPLITRAILLTVVSKMAAQAMDFVKYYFEKVTKNPDFEATTKSGFFNLMTLVCGLDSQ
jgi:hypothetical protein